MQEPAIKNNKPIFLSITKYDLLSAFDKFDIYKILYITRVEI